MKRPQSCSDCSSMERRDFVKLGGAVVAGAASAGLFDARLARADSASRGAAETSVGEFYASLTDVQKKAICLPSDHRARGRISANWHVTQRTIGDGLFDKRQMATIQQIVRSITSEDGYERLMRQMEDDDGGWKNYSVALFGEPGTENFQWEMTGRHVTLRADGNRLDKVAFGGPIVYGHGHEDPKNNLFHYQTKQANEVFRALDPKQAGLALLKKAPRESAVQLQGPDGKFSGIEVDALSEDQKHLVTATLKVLLAPYRQEDVDEVMAILESRGGLDQLHMAFYQEDDLSGDKVWDIWRVEGPSFVWHFRGAPHVHAYINIGVIG